MENNEIIKIKYGENTKLQIDSAGVIVYAEGLNELFVSTEDKDVDNKFVGKNIGDFISECQNLNIYLSASFYELVFPVLSKEELLKVIKYLDNDRKETVKILNEAFATINYNKEITSAINSGLDLLIKKQASNNEPKKSKRKSIFKRNRD